MFDMFKVTFYKKAVVSVKFNDICFSWEWCYEKLNERKKCFSAKRNISWCVTTPNYSFPNFILFRLATMLLIQARMLLWQEDFTGDVFTIIPTYSQMNFPLFYPINFGTLQVYNKNKWQIEAKFRRALKKLMFGKLMFMPIVFQTSNFTLKLSQLKCSPWNSILVSRKCALNKSLRDLNRIYFSYKPINFLRYRLKSDDKSRSFSEQKKTLNWAQFVLKIFPLHVMLGTKWWKLRPSTLILPKVLFRMGSPSRNKTHFIFSVDSFQFSFWNIPHTRHLRYKVIKIASINVLIVPKNLLQIKL